MSLAWLAYTTPLQRRQRHQEFVLRRVQRLLAAPASRLHQPSRGGQVAVVVAPVLRPPSSSFTACADSPVNFFEFIRV